jgi:spermidine synthase
VRVLPPSLIDRGASAAVLSVAAIAGAGTMVVELAAVRLLAPWFGTSLVVWTNVIAVILLALALGYLIGGRLAAGRVPVASLGWVLLAAGALVAWLPFTGAAVADALLPEEVALHEAAGLVGWASLAVALIVFLPAAVLLGTVCPLVVETLARARQLSAGRAGGAVLFVSTIGSLAGVFGTSHVLLPGLGVRRTFWLAAATLFAAGVLATWLARSRWPGGRGVGAMLLVGAASSTMAPEQPALPAGRVELARRESPYQTLRVVEDQTQGEPLRYLQVNEGFDSFQSVWQARPGVLPEGFYYNDFLLPLSWGDVREPWRVLVLGLGAGTVVRVFGGQPEIDARFVGVELDPAVVAVGREYFDLPADGPRQEVWGGLDARVALRVATGEFEQIVLDCYANQVEIPAHLCTLEFFRELREHLVVGGWLTANLGGFGFDDPVVSAVARTCALAFEQDVLLVRVPQSRNYMLLARNSAELPWSEGVLAPASRESRIALGPRRLPGFARVIRPEPGFALTDDLCPVELLQLESIRKAQELRGVHGT